MRITRDLLIKLAKETVQQRIKTDRNLVAAILVGSTLSENPFLGGTTDIDLVYVCINAMPNQREIVKLSNEVHLDIVYRETTDFEPARKLRNDPHLGYMIYDSHLLYDARHFYEYTQAIMRAGFIEPENILARARQHSIPARQMWLNMSLGIGDRPEDIQNYLKAVYHAANAVAILNGPPLTERRFLLDFPARAVAAEHPELNAGLLELIGAYEVIASDMLDMLPDWQATYNAAASDAGDPAIHPARLAYYRNAISFMLQEEQSHAAVWPLLHSWTLAAHILPGYSPEVIGWKAIMSRFGLAFESLDQKVQLLDHFLDNVEELLDNYAAANGIVE
jgi:hypothetical protein